jgi:hypothetical protein
MKLITYNIIKILLLIFSFSKFVFKYVCALFIEKEVVALKTIMVPEEVAGSVNVLNQK